jgi:hypothetical protein
MLVRDGTAFVKLLQAMSNAQAKQYLLDDFLQRGIIGKTPDHIDDLFPWRYHAWPSSRARQYTHPSLLEAFAEWLPKEPRRRVRRQLV